MAKLRLTKSELKKQRDDLKRFSRFLPTLELKRIQLQQEIDRVQGEIVRLQVDIEATEAEVAEWAAVFAEAIDLGPFLQVEWFEMGTHNIAGIEVPMLRQVVFQEQPVDPFATPLWVDRGIEAARVRIRQLAALQTAIKQQELLAEEMRRTIQRINLFEQVKIPQARRHIRSIHIFLGDQQTAAVVRSKIAMAKRKQQEGRE